MSTEKVKDFEEGTIEGLFNACQTLEEVRVVLCGELAEMKILPSKGKGKTGEGWWGTIDRSVGDEIRRGIPIKEIFKKYCGEKPSIKVITNSYGIRNTVERVLMIEEIKKKEVECEFSETGVFDECHSFQEVKKVLFEKFGKGLADSTDENRHAEDWHVEIKEAEEECEKINASKERILATKLKSITRNQGLRNAVKRAIENFFSTK